MFFFDHERRSDEIPAFFIGPAADRLRLDIELRLKVVRAERDQSDVPPIWKATLDSSVISSLERLSFGRCAFCERANLKLSPYRFRPPAYAEPIKPAEGKDSYLWLAFAWSNFFPICDDCRPRRPNYFPVEDARASYPGTASGDPGLRLGEDPLLIFPGQLANPGEEFEVAADGWIVGLKRRGRETITHFQLNHPEKVAQRSRVLADLIAAILQSSDLDRQYVRDADFSGAQFLFLQRFMRMMAREVRLFEPPVATKSEELISILNQWSETIGFLSDAEVVLARLKAQDRRRRRPGRRIGPLQASASQQLEHAPLKSVSIRGYKSLEAIDFELPGTIEHRAEILEEEEIKTPRPEAPCLLLLGENATGKSSILEAIALAALPSKVTERLIDTEALLCLNPEFMGDPVRAPLSDGNVDISFHDQTRRTVSLAALQSADLPAAEADSQPLVFAYGAHRLYGARRRTEKVRHVDTLFRNNRQISNPEEWLRGLAKTNEEALNEVVSALRHIIQIDGKFESIEFRQIGRSPSDRCVIRVRKTRPDGSDYIVPLPLDAVSSGYRAILALVCDVLEGLFVASRGKARDARHARAIVLIDEIEAHLHPRWKMHVIGGLRKALPRTTFIITTHDPLCIRGMFNGEVVVLNRYVNVAGDGLGLPERVELVRPLDDIETMTIEQLLTSDFFQLYSTDSQDLDRDFAKVAGILAKEEARLPLDTGETSLLEDFRSRIAKALPFGRGEVTRIVEDALAKFMSERRDQSARDLSQSRQAAVDAVKSFLQEMVDDRR